MSFTTRRKLTEYGVELGRAKRASEGRRRAMDKSELVKQHSDRWRYDRKAATTVIGRKPGESRLMGLPDDRNPPAAAGRENGAETTRIPERRATAFLEARHSL